MPSDALIRAFYRLDGPDSRDSVAQLWGSATDILYVPMTDSKKRCKANEMHGTGSEVEKLIDAVAGLLQPEEIELPEEFFPAHLTIALIDAVYRSESGSDQDAATSVEKYCDRFGLSRTRPDRWELPPAHEQDSLSDMIRRYDELGLDGMMGEVFSANRNTHGTNLSIAEAILRAARALREVNVEVLQDMKACRAEEIEGALRHSAESDDSTARMLLMYTGDDDFVRGDACILEFVAHAIERSTVPVKHAERLVRRSAYELILAPRFLDRAIWKYGIHGQ